MLHNKGNLYFSLNCISESSKAWFKHNSHNLSWYFKSPTGETGGDLWFALCLSVSQSVCLSHFSGSCDNFKSSSYFFMKLETWIDGNMDIMHVISFCYYVKNSDCYGNKYTRNTAENGGFLNPAITLKFFIFFHETCNIDRWQYGHYARHFILFLRQKLWLLWQPEKIIWKWWKFWQ